MIILCMYEKTASQLCKDHKPYGSLFYSNLDKSYIT